MGQATTRASAQPPEAKRAWLQAAIATAIVAGVFSAVVSGFMVVDALRSQAEDIRTADRLAELKAALRGDPMNEGLKERIRALDVELRRNFFLYSHATNTGRWLLLAGLVVGVVALKAASVLRRKLPKPHGAGAMPGWADRLAQASRWSVAATGVLLVLGAAGLALTASSILGRREGAGEAAATYPSDDEVAGNWPRFRGPWGLGVAAYANAPTAWDGATGQGILWKAAVPLNAPSSPVVWGDRVFLTGSSKERLDLYCFDVATGQLLWTHAATGIPGSPAQRPKTMEGVEWAPSTPATDGARVYALFATGDVVAVDFAGQRAWARNLGTPENSYGHASSLALWRNRLLVLYDQATADDKKSKLMALDTATGRTVWETKRDTPQTWTTPIIAKSGQGDQIIVCGDPFLCGYEAASGKELWRAECLGGEIAPSPVYANGVAYAANAGSYASAVRTDGSGNVTETHILWKAEDGLPDIASPLTNGELFWTLSTGGTLTCYDAKTGKRVWEKDLEENCSSSPSLAGDKVFVTTEKGVTILVAAAREFKELGRCKLGEGCRTTPAFLDGRIILRGEKHLFCIGKK
ncbi:MAG TPA: PQQ-binding-like beta-propeller repeat protein [Planctomycetota bacterium]|nr:PQQ-binding-like beta-propeller repeat protein [Planctomycetota bacterium]HRR81614.1 PQQ-binding-like beta-propeller repeat protein [Planctomycetota bacterium]HRT93087.1 PQQ-binding-like beta-propeller repeat protein [Planctomycetota bacterium]